ncbi:AsnC family transcriptional regulator [Halorubellus sp. JP-L1]|uniref:Lrp/AsnC family transcriptional regulator n=1 Tax=Halorubellus sp. JP-L1 TaxID=2715753 RepID=UPI0014072421|nr:TrkA C-terminal domain-containing protein [Halorubellus sp. JP-L1]NHN42624.1 AsnC family transcriptional regulator [Halorubellus sp. JP-L1]
MTRTSTDHRLDEIDRYILHALMQDARNTTAAAIAESLSVSGATVRNRIQKLEDQGVIREYPTQVDFERAGGKLTNLYRCNVPVPEREALAHKARSIPGVVNVRTLMTGRENLHVLAVGETTAELQRISRTISQLGIEIEDEDLVEDEFFSPYAPFNPDTDREERWPNDFISLTGDADIVELTVQSNAPIVGRSLKDAVQAEILDDDTLVIGIERDDRELTPHGDTVVEADDIVTVLSRASTDADGLDAFRAPAAESTRQ